MHAIGDDIKAVIAKLVRDLNSNVQLSELKGDEILATDVYYKKWLEDIRYGERSAFWAVLSAMVLTVRRNEQ